MAFLTVMGNQQSCLDYVQKYIFSQNLLQKL